jgi:putative RNA 2'-phosphotransferase
MLSKSEISTGKLLSLVLRHKPQEIGLTLDKHGWADVDELLLCLKRSGCNLNFKTLEKIVNENDKHRYSFNDDKTKIRANQGHSIPVDVELKKATPPELLYHGTASRFLGSIRNSGIQKSGRIHVHLSSDYKTALNVGIRHGKPVVLTVMSGKMHDDGFEFFLSENGVWLCENVPVKYIQEFAEDDKE